MLRLRLRPPPLSLPFPSEFSWQCSPPPKLKKGLKEEINGIEEGKIWLIFRILCISITLRGMMGEMCHHPTWFLNKPLEGTPGYSKFPFSVGPSIRTSYHLAFCVTIPHIFLVLHFLLDCPLPIWNELIFLPRRSRRCPCFVDSLSLFLQRMPLMMSTLSIERVRIRCIPT